MGTSSAQLAHVQTFLSMVPNDVVLIIADDFGIDKVGCYGKGANLNLTPNIDKLYNGWNGRKGIRYDAAWATPVCSPTRASILTGRLPGRTGIGTAIRGPGAVGSYAGACAEWALASTETCIPHRLSPEGYACGQFGKWHLHHPCPDETGYDFVRDIAGFDQAEGWPFNFNPRGGTGATETANSMLYSSTVKDQFGVNIYAGVPWIVNGLPSPGGSPVVGSLVNNPASNDWWGGGYDTTRIVNAFSSWFGTTAGPLFAWVAFHSIHTPLQWPPYAQHSQTQNYPNPYAPDPARAGTPIQEGEFFNTLTDAGYDPAVKPWTYAMIQAMDYQVGRLLDSIRANRPNATVIFIGDNGSAASEGSDGWDVEAPFIPDQAKATMYEGGIQVPLIINAPWIDEPGRPIGYPVQASDLFATICELGGTYGGPTGNDSCSLLPALLDVNAWPTRCGALSQFFRPSADPALFGVTAFTTRWYAARCGSMKLIRRVVDDPGDEMYDLLVDPWEATDLLAGGVGALDGRNLASYNKLSKFINDYISGVEGL